MIKPIVPILTLSEYIVAGMQVTVVCMGGCGNKQLVNFPNLMEMYGQTVTWLKRFEPVSVARTVAGYQEP